MRCSASRIADADADEGEDIEDVITERQSSPASRFLKLSRSNNEEERRRVPPPPGLWALPLPLLAVSLADDAVGSGKWS
jgi:hypothetical protein